MLACVFAKLPDKRYFDFVEFYQQDIRVLHELGFDVTFATRWSEVPWNADLYFIWWWTWAFVPLSKALVGRRPTLITGAFDLRWPVPGHDYYSRPRLQKELIRFALYRAGANVFISGHEYGAVVKSLGARNPWHVPLTVDTQVYRPGGAPREDIVFSVIWMEGSNAERKCVSQIIRAIPQILRNHPSMRFVIAGEKGSYFPRVESLVRELGVSDRADFPGIISREQKIDLMQRCKVYLQPTVYEGFGLAILEAMSCGGAVVSSPVGAVPEVVGDAGVLIDGGSTEAIAAAVNRLLADDVDREHLGTQGRRRAETLFPYEKRKQGLQRVISDLLARR